MPSSPCSKLPSTSKTQRQKPPALALGTPSKSLAGQKKPKTSQSNFKSPPGRKCSRTPSSESKSSTQSTLESCMSSLENTSANSYPRKRRPSGQPCLISTDPELTYLTLR